MNLTWYYFGAWLTSVFCMVCMVRHPQERARFGFWICFLVAFLFTAAWPILALLIVGSILRRTLFPRHEVRNREDVL